jgi:hypothetical protein
MDKFVDSLQPAEVYSVQYDDEERERKYKYCEKRELRVRGLLENKFPEELHDIIKGNYSTPNKLLDDIKTKNFPRECITYIIELISIISMKNMYNSFNPKYKSIDYGGKGT